MAKKKDNVDNTIIIMEDRVRKRKKKTKEVKQDQRMLTT